MRMFRCIQVGWVDEGLQRKEFGEFGVGIFNGNKRKLEKQIFGLELERSLFYGFST